MFKVVPDQLRISEGWVRCGHCAEVFDASANLDGKPAATPAAALPGPQPQPEPPLEPPPAEPTPQTAALPAPQPAPAAFAQPPWVEPPGGVAMPDEPHFVEPQYVEPPLTQPQRTEPQAPDIGAPPEPVREPVFGPFVAPEPEHLYRVPSVKEWRASESGEAEAAESLPAARAGDADSLSDDLAGEVSFVRQARRQAFWRRPMVRGLLGLAGVLLLGALVLQVALQERDRIAVQQPALAPVLQALCAPLGCTVGPPRQIESIVIDATTFSKLRSDAYRLNLTLRNQAAMPVAMPAIELTLTDAQDQALVRRVILPRELASAPDAIAAAGDWSGALSMTVASSAARVAGYRVLAFYP